MGELGLTGVPFPSEIGGAGFTYRAWTLVMEEIAYADMAMAVSLSVHILSQYPVITWGTDEQKARWLPDMLTGKTDGCLRADRATGGLRCGRAQAARRSGRARPSAPVSYAPDRHQDLDQQLRPGRALPRLCHRPIRRWARAGITAFLVEKEHARLHARRARAQAGHPLRLDGRADLRRRRGARPTTVLGQEGMGYKIALSALSEGRISIAAACVGLAQAALDAAAKYLTERRAFGGPLSDQQGLRFMLAEMAQKVAAARALTRAAAEAKDRGEPIAEASSLAKWTASDAAMSVTTDAVQLFGGNGYSREFPVERFMRDAKGAQIYEGTNQIHRLIVADHVLKRVTQN